MKKFDIVVILVCALVVGGIAATKVYKQKIGSIPTQGSNPGLLHCREFFSS